MHRRSCAGGRPARRAHRPGADGGSPRSRSRAGEEAAVAAQVIRRDRAQGRMEARRARVATPTYPRQARPLRQAKLKRLVASPANGLLGSGAEGSAARKVAVARSSGLPRIPVRRPVNPPPVGGRAGVHSLLGWRRVAGGTPSADRGCRRAIVGQSEMNGFHVAKPVIARAGSFAGFDIGVASCRHTRAFEVHECAPPLRGARGSSRPRVVSAAWRHAPVQPSQTMVVACISDDDPVYHGRGDPRRQVDDGGFRAAELQGIPEPRTQGPERFAVRVSGAARFPITCISGRCHQSCPCCLVLLDTRQSPAGRGGSGTPRRWSFPGDRPVPAAGAREASLRWRQGRLPRRHSLGVIRV